MSRWLLRDLLRRGDRLHAVGHVVVDTALAVGFLLLLVAVLPAAVQAGNIALVEGLGEPPVDWQPYLAAAIEAPWTAGLMITGMLVSTLVPTVLHLALAVFALLVGRAPGLAWARRTLERTNPPLHFGDEFFLTLWFLASGTLSLAAVIACGCGLLLAVGFVFGETFAAWLLDIAAWSATAVGGPALPDFGSLRGLAV